MNKKFKHTVKVYYEDTDAGGVVYYTNYLNYLERARTEAILSIGLSNNKIKEDFGTLIIVKSCNIQYKKSAYLEDVLTINSFIKSFTKASFLMSQIIKRKDEMILSSEVCLVTVNKKGKQVKIPEILNKLFY